MPTESLLRIENGAVLKCGAGAVSVDVPDGFHKSPRPQRAGFITVKDDNIIMTALKLCEDGSGDAVMRFYESRGRETRTFIVCDMLDAGFFADFLPFETKTFRIGKDGRATEVNFLEGIVKPDRPED